eukprot:4596736-Amphidinium_carterae.1
MARLISKSSLSEPEPVLRGEMIVHLCLCREVLKDCVLQLELHDAETKWFKYVYAKQQPFQLYLQPLQLLDQTLSLPHTLTRNAWEQSQKEYREYIWEFHTADYCGGDDFVGVNPEDIKVVANVVYETSARLSTRSSLEPLLHHTGPLRRPARRPRNEATGSAGPELPPKKAKTDEVPAWMQNLLGTYKDTHKGKSGEHEVPVAGVDLEGPDTDDEDYEETFAAVFLELERRRTEIKEREHDMSDCFGMALLGGRGVAKKGKAVHGCRCLAKPTSFVYAFLSFFGLPVTSSFEFTVYTEVVAYKLLELWQH